ncbi:hypothetical protein C8F04DRAFT_1073863 [Mycena alexandri]|uniref:F-box domain-containing protein n=1 Tax=Mycena alexandri TaxID=1745969 RepID=A0AAD6TD22_9AGAR|nr:hypothetical protein C8F04DRAFT_1073863 [Mycena alexandri]
MRAVEALESLTRALRQRRYRDKQRATSGVPSSQSFGTSVLPFELWDLVVQDLTDKDLLRVSAVCRAFNAVAIGEYLARHNVAISSKEVSVPSDVTRALQISCTPPDVERLVCHFKAFDIHRDIYRDLLSLRRMVDRSQNIRDLTLSFAGDFFHAHKWSGVGSPRELRGAACAVFSAMAIKVDGPVIVVGTDASSMVRTLFLCRAKDIAGWRLDLFQFNRAVVPNHLAARLLRFFRSGTGPEIPPQTKVRLPSEPTSKQFTLAEMHTVNTSVRDDEPEVGPYTMLIFNIPFLKLLDLNTRYISAPQLTALLGHLTLPALESLSLSTPDINPVVFGKFLLRHTKLQTFHLCVESSSPLVSPGIAHPTLARIEASGVESICLTIESLHLSPLLAYFAFSVPALDLAGLNPAFSLITQGGLEAHLSLMIESSPDDAVEGIMGILSEETVSIAQTLHCFRSVKIVCRSTHTGLRVVQWLALFPTLLTVRFTLFIGPRPRSQHNDLQRERELQKFMTEVKNILTHVPEVWGSAY